MDGLLHGEAKENSSLHGSQMGKAKRVDIVRASLAFAIIRGSRVKWRSGLGMDDGAPLYSIL